MSYVAKHLLPGEEIGYRAHLHPIIFLQPALFALVGLGFVAYWLLHRTLPAFGVLGAVFLVYAVGHAAGRAVNFASSEFAITNKRVLIKVGFIHRQSLEMLLNKVETIRVDQSILGRVFGYGTIVVIGTGGTNEPFRAIANPLEFRRQTLARAAG